jgi:hypothetical protein
MRNKIVATIVILGLVSLIMALSHNVTSSSITPLIHIAVLTSNDSTSSDNFTLSIAVSTTPASNSIDVYAMLFYNGTKPYILNKTIANGPIAFGCGPSELLYGVSIYRGYYTANNISGASALEISEPEIYNCPAGFGVSNAIFLPQSYNAVYAVNAGNPTINRNITVSQIITSSNISGYWVVPKGTPACDVPNASCSFFTFEPGVYTVIVTDFIRQKVLVYFEVN